MKILLTKSNLLLLLSLLVVVEAGFFDNFKKHDKGKLKKDSSQVSAPTTPADKVEPGAEEVGDIADELTSMDKVRRPKKPTKFSTLMAKAKENEKVAAAQQQASAVEEEEEEAPATEEPVKVKPNARNVLNKHKNGNTAQNQDENSKSKHTVRPKVHLNNRDNNQQSKHPSHHFGGKIMHAHFWKDEMKNTYKSTKAVLKPMAEQMVEQVAQLPTYVSQATDSLAATLKLDSRGRLLAMINEVDEDIAFVRREFSSFSVTWSPLMEKSLSYIGRTGLHKLNWNSKDELDYREDALVSAAFGYEFMRLMMAWRENLMVGHHAYKNYLEQVVADQEKEKFTVDENFMFQLEAIHNYILLNSWMELDQLSIESKLKLDFLMEVNDNKPKNYESEYFRQIVVFQELYEPTINEFNEERKQVIEALAETGSSDEEFEEIDHFFEDFKNNLAEGGEFENIDWEVPKQLEEFMDSLKEELRFNLIVYSKSFLKVLKEAKEKAISEMYD